MQDREAKCKLIIKQKQKQLKVIS